MYIPYVSCNYKLSGMFTCKFGKGPKIRGRTSDILDVSTPSRGESHRGVVIRVSECRTIPQRRVSVSHKSIEMERVS